MSHLHNMVHYKVSIDWPEVITTQVDADVDLSYYNLSTNNRGYIQLYVDGKRQLLHRHVMGLVPGDKRDHVNGDKLDNRRVNLRVVSHAENNRFKGPTKFCKSGLKE